MLLFKSTINRSIIRRISTTKSNNKKKPNNSVGEFNVETTKFDSSDKDSEDFRKFAQMPVEKTPEAAAPKVETLAEAPVATSVA